MKKTLLSRGILAAFVCFLCLTSAFAETAFAADGDGEGSLFFLSPTFSGYFPTDGKTQDAFGDSWSGWGVSVNLEALGWASSGWEVAGLSLRPYFGYFHADKDDNDAHIIPIGLDARWNLARLGVVSPYVGLGIAGYGIRFEDRGAGIDTGWRGAFGGRLMFGADITRWFNIQAAYNLISDVEGYDLSGFSLQGKLRIYF